MLKITSTFSFAVLLWMTLPLSSPALQGSDPTVRLHVDLTEIDRHLIKSTIVMPVQPGALSLWYPKWLPGCHAPAGSIQNLANFKVISDQGETIPWKRRSADPFEFKLVIPEGVDSIEVQLSYITNQETTNSEGADTRYLSNLGYFSFNTCVIYPGKSSVNELIYEASLKLPLGISAQGALPVAHQSKQTIHYKPVTLLRLIDSPLILGEHLKTYNLTEADSPFPPHFLHVAARDPKHIELPADFVSGCQRLVGQAIAAMGKAPFDEYHFLLIVDDELADIGLEHLRCSLNTVSIKEMEDPGLRADWPSLLLPHEYVHAWCGKYRIPKGMAQENFHSDKDLQLLWIYEGLTEYYGNVLAVRSGLNSKKNFVDHRANQAHLLTLQTGRQWRSLEDTAITSHLLRDYSNYWQFHRRSQDYYEEGAFYWWEVDAMIRHQTNNRASLDDFCIEFFSGNQRQDYVPFTEGDVYRTLQEIAPHNWKGFFEQRFKTTQKLLNMQAIAKSGYKLVYNDQQSNFLKRFETEYGYVDESVCMGLSVNEHGMIVDIVPGRGADQAKLSEDDFILQINNEAFTLELLRNTIKASSKERKMTLLISRHGREMTVPISLGDPSKRYPQLVRTEKEDLLEQILKPKTAAMAPIDLNRR